MHAQAGSSHRQTALATSMQAPSSYGSSLQSIADLCCNLKPEQPTVDKDTEARIMEALGVLPMLDPFLCWWRTVPLRSAHVRFRSSILPSLRALRPAVCKAWAACYQVERIAPRCCCYNHCDVAGRK